MAWEKEIVLENDVSLKHWDVKNIIVNLQAGLIEINYSGWVTRSSKEQSKPPVIDGRESIPLSENPDLDGLLSFARQKIMALQMFIGAEEV